LNKGKALLLAILSGLLLWASWPGSSLTALIFIAWIPLLYLSDLPISKRKFLLLCYVAMLVWNVGTTWWIWNATAEGSVAAWIVNSFLMCLPWLGYVAIKKRLSETRSLLALIAFWMSFELIHLRDWGLSWPWLTLGNVFAMHPNFVSWYQYTGVAGGSLLVLSVNVLFYLALKQKSKKFYIIGTGVIVALIFIDLINQFRVAAPTEKLPANVVIVQPNIDPYEKVTPGTSANQLDKLIRLSESKIDSNTQLVVWPETALYSPYGYNEKELTQTPSLIPLFELLKRHPKVQLFTGIESYAIVNGRTEYSRPLGNLNYEAYNGSVLLDKDGVKSTYHKSMLVPGVETLPWFLHFMDSWFDKFGGTTAGYAKQTERTPVSTYNHFTIAPAICYESIYGNFMRQFIHNGANVICVITNDGWWKKTPGHIQHFNYARLRAIENNCWVIRSANTGISAFIDANGKVYEPQGYDTTAAISMAVSAVNKKTFYSTYGDWLYYLLSGLSVLLLVAFFLSKKRV
jgi:apolipoprotein N-acyltransferase